MSNEFNVNLDDYTETDLKTAIVAKQKTDAAGKNPLQQFGIILKHNSISITVITALLTGTVWQRENINRVTNPTTEVINRQIITHNLPEDVELNSRKIETLSKALEAVESQLDDLAYYVKKKGYTRRKR